jgi:hypothetical protein
MQSIYSDFYKIGASDALCDGLNTEVSQHLTMIRRPGNPKYCSVETAAGVDNFYSFHHADGTIQVIADTATDVDVVTPTSITSIFTKTTGAAEAFCQGVDEFLYIADGVDTQLYAPENLTLNPVTGKQCWNMNGVAPTVAPVLTVIPESSLGVAWVASTVFSTMGLIYDGTSVQQLLSVNASGTNSTQLGTTAGGEPNFTGGPGTSITESGGTPITWTNWGPIDVWKPNHAYTNWTIGGTVAAPSFVYDEISGSIYIVDNPSLGSGTSGSIKPNFTGVFGSIFYDGSIKWYCISSAGNMLPSKWQASHVYVARNQFPETNGCIVTPTTIQAANLGTATATVVYIWVATNAGTSSNASGYYPNWATVIGNPTIDGDCVWGCLGSGTWQANYSNYVAWSNTSNMFSAIVDSAGNFQVALTVTGPSGGTAPTWATGYGQTTQDGANVGTSTFVGVTWVCVGPETLWTASTQWYLPKGGFVPPSPAQPYGGAVVQDNNSPINNQYVIASGLSGLSQPSPWKTVGETTIDGTVTWYAGSPYSAANFTWTKGYGYVYCYYARTSDDYYCTNPPPLQIPGTNSPNITGPLGAPTGSQSGTVTDASPLTQITGSGSNEAVQITMVGSTDPQFDTILLFRSSDGFGVSGPYLFCSAFPMPARNGGQPGTLTIIDFMPDLPTSLLPGLDPLEEAPVDGQNAPPPGSYGSDQFQPLSTAYPTQPAPGTAITGLVYYLGRLWGFIGTSVFASGGPDTDPGNGFTAWPAINEFPFDSPIIRLLPTSSCLLVFTTTDVYLLGGGPAIADFYSQLLAPGVGLLSWNAVTMMLGLPYLYTSDHQFVTIDPSGGFTRIGHPIGDTLALYNPADVYVAFHSYGDADHALFVANGASEWYRCDPNPAPDAQITGPIWSPRATISTQLCQAVQEVETSPGVKQLLIGPAGAGYILARDSTFETFADAGSPYEAYFTVGNVVLAHPGQMAECAFIECDFTQIGSQPSVFVLFDELAPSLAVGFEEISGTFVSDPPKLYGPTGTPSTLWMNRYYFGQNITTNTDTQGQALGAFVQSDTYTSASASSITMSVAPEETYMWALFAFASYGQSANYGPGAGWTLITTGIGTDYGQGIYSQMVGVIAAPTAILPSAGNSAAGALALFQTDGNTPQIVQSATSVTWTPTPTDGRIAEATATLTGAPAVGDGLIAIVLINDVGELSGFNSIYDSYGNFWTLVAWADPCRFAGVLGTDHHAIAAIWYCPQPSIATRSIVAAQFSRDQAIAQGQVWVYEVSHLLIPPMAAGFDVVAAAQSAPGTLGPDGGPRGTNILTAAATPSASATEWALLITTTPWQSQNVAHPGAGWTIVNENGFSYAGYTAYKNLSSTAPISLSLPLTNGVTSNWSTLLILFGNQPTVVQSGTVNTSNDYYAFTGTGATHAGNSLIVTVHGILATLSDYPPSVPLYDTQGNVYQPLAISVNLNSDESYNYGWSGTWCAFYAAQDIPGGDVTVYMNPWYPHIANYPPVWAEIFEVTPFTLIPGQHAYQPAPAWCKFLQLKVDFGDTDEVQNELQAFTIFGALYQEK